MGVGLNMECQSVTLKEAITIVIVSLEKFDASTFLLWRWRSGFWNGVLLLLLLLLLLLKWNNEVSVKRKYFQSFVFVFLSVFWSSPC